MVFPAGAGVIPTATKGVVEVLGVSRRRGGDPAEQREHKLPVKCFPQARG